MLSRFFQESDHLLARYAGESLEELLDRIASLQMIEQTLYWNAGPSEDRLTAEDLRILRNNAAHEQNYALETQSIQANITDLSRRSVARRRITCHSSLVTPHVSNICGSSLYEQRIKREAKLA